MDTFVVIAGIVGAFLYLFLAITLFALARVVYRIKNRSDDMFDLMEEDIIRRREEARRFQEDMRRRAL